MLTLSLDYERVAQAWEKLGGADGIYASGDVQSPADNIDLDLSSWEASLNPVCKLEELCTFDHPYNCWSLPVDFSAQQHGCLPAQACIDSQVVPEICASLQLSDSASAASELHVPDCRPSSCAAQQAMDNAADPCSSNSDAVVPDIGSNFSSTATSSCSTQVQTDVHPQALTAIAKPSAPVYIQDGDVVFLRTRVEALERYREKKARRAYTKRIRYQLRKINADKRPRIKGRFVKKEELDQYMRAHGPASADGLGAAEVDDEMDDDMEQYGFDSDDE